jgi:hypothetical protein
MARMTRMTRMTRMGGMSRKLFTITHVGFGGEKKLSQGAPLQDDSAA